MSLMISQKQYAKLNGWSIAQVSNWRKDGYIYGWIKLPNGRIFIPADARTRFRPERARNPLPLIREQWERRTRHVGYKRGVEWRQAMRLELESAMDLAG